MLFSIIKKKSKKVSKQRRGKSDIKPGSHDRNNQNMKFHYKLGSKVRRDVLEDRSKLFARKLQDYCNIYIFFNYRNYLYNIILYRTC